MPGKSLEPVKVTYLDGEAAVARLRELVGRLVTLRPDVLAVYLFGSLAEERHAPRSDADLLVVLAADNRRRIDRIPELVRAFLEAPLPVDVIPLTSQELSAKLEEGDAFVRHILSRGVLLSGRREGRWGPA